MSKDHIKFSVLMSVYKNDKVEFVKEAIESIINQTVKPDEIVIVKDGPIPKVVDEMILDYKQKNDHFKIIPLEKNVGLGNALNIGLEHCSFDLVARMDSDDICVQDRFEKQLYEFEKDDTLSVVGGYISEFIEAIDKSVGIRKVPLENNDIRINIKNQNPFNHMTVMFNKNNVFEAGNYQDFPLYEDYYLWIRMFLKNMKFKNIDSILVNARVGSDMYKRRGGWNYYKTGFEFQKILLKNKIITYPKFIINVCIRFIVQVLMPNRVRGFFYQKFARN